MSVVCAQIVHQMESKVQLMSFHSVSKGVVGECGRRGGYLELVNFEQVRMVRWLPLSENCKS